MDRNEISYSKAAVVYAGPDAVKLYKAKVLVASLRLYARTGIIPTRGVGITVMLKIAKEFTGKDYKRSQTLEAAEDVAKWAREMQDAIPTTVEGVQQ